MADLTQTAGNVQIMGSNASLKIKQVGEAVVQGQPIYKNTSDSNKYHLCDADTSAEAECEFITLTPAAADEYTICVGNDGALVDLGATLTVGETYVVSTNEGKVAPIGDLTTGDYVTILGTATAADTLKLKVNPTGAVKP